MTQLEWTETKRDGCKAVIALTSHRFPNGQATSYFIQCFDDETNCVISVDGGIDATRLCNAPRLSLDAAKAACQANEDELDRRDNKAELLAACEAAMTLRAFDRQVTNANLSHVEQMAALREVQRIERQILEGVLNEKERGTKASIARGGAEVDRTFGSYLHNLTCTM